MGGLNDHIVGGGKTLIEIVTAIELKRLKMANKPLIIGLKSQIPQLYKIFKQAYPLSKVLFPKEKDFAKDNRKKLLNNIATNDWDCIILSHDQYNMIKQPVDIQINLLKELSDAIQDEIFKCDDKIELKRLEKRLYKYEQKIKELNDTKKDTDILSFDKLGIDFLIVDESHEYKNLEFTSQMRNIRGLGNQMGSKKAFNMLTAEDTCKNFIKGIKAYCFVRVRLWRCCNGGGKRKRDSGIILFIRRLCEKRASLSLCIYSGCCI